MRLGDAGAETFRPQGVWAHTLLTHLQLPGVVLPSGDYSMDFPVHKCGVGAASWAPGLSSLPAAFCHLATGAFPDPES